MATKLSHVKALAREVIAAAEHMEKTGRGETQHPWVEKAAEHLRLALVAVEELTAEVPLP